MATELRRALINPGISTVLLALLSYGVASAPLAAEVAPSTTMTYSRIFDVSEAEAAHRISAMVEAREAQTFFRENFPDTFGGLYIQHAPEFKVVVKFIRNSEPTLRLATSNPTFVSETSSATLDELLDLQSSISASLLSQGERHMSGLDLKDSAVDVFVRSGASRTATRFLATFDRSLIRLHETSGFIETTAKLRVGLDGGQTLRSADGGFCTSGFNVRQGTTRGITTAGHCENTLSRSGLPIVFMGEANKGSHDFQWHLPPESTTVLYEPTHYVQALSQLRSISRVKSHSQMVVGDFICKFGNETYETCGVIADLNSNSIYEGEIGVYVRATSPEGRLMTDYGDSGGAVYGLWDLTNTRWDTAYGLVHGRGAEGTIYERDLFFMPTDRLSELGLEILTVTNVSN